MTEASSNNDTASEVSLDDTSKALESRLAQAKYLVKLVNNFIVIVFVLSTWSQRGKSRQSDYFNCSIFSVVHGSNPYEEKHLPFIYLSISNSRGKARKYYVFMNISVAFVPINNKIESNVEQVFDVCLVDEAASEAVALHEEALAQLPKLWHFTKRHLHSFRGCDTSRRGTCTSPEAVALYEEAFAQLSRPWHFTKRHLHSFRGCGTSRRGACTTFEAVALHTKGHLHSFRGRGTSRRGTCTASEAVALYKEALAQLPKLWHFSKRCLHNIWLKIQPWCVNKIIQFSVYSILLQEIITSFKVLPPAIKCILKNISCHVTNSQVLVHISTVPIPVAGQNCIPTRNSYPLS